MSNVPKVRGVMLPTQQDTAQETEGFTARKQAVLRQRRIFLAGTRMSTTSCLPFPVEHYYRGYEL